MTLGVEEEFHLVELRARQLTPRASEVLSSLAGSPTLDVECVPTRVAASGSLVVNSSRGGGAKDTWDQIVP